MGRQEGAEVRGVSCLPLAMWVPFPALLSPKPVPRGWTQTWLLPSLAGVGVFYYSVKANLGVDRRFLFLLNFLFRDLLSPA